MSSPPPDPFALPEWAPAVSDVAALLRARTKDATGREVGTFNTDTRPDDVAVSALIVLGCGDITANVGTDIDSTLWPEARALAALKTACYIESSYWPEQVGSDRSPWNELWAMYQFELRNLKDSAASGGGAGTIGAGSICAPPDWSSCWPDGGAYPADAWQRNLDHSSS